ncbi:MAG: hypothetical protein QMD36_04865 [Candidatus Aenigmarchaeota archaeon]|nr:hypothetical protein [Candidatus Aenigmarchaeota archaeon]
MNWKEFLRLDRRKFLVWLLLIIITFMIPFFTSILQFLMVINPILYFFVYLVATLEMTVFNFRLILEVSLVLINGILLSLCWYFLSCFIVFEWNRLKEKRLDKEKPTPITYSAG